MQRIVVVAVLAALVCVVNAQQLIPAVKYGGFQVIFSNDTSFLDEIDVHRNTIYAAGAGIVREIIEEPFQLDSSPKFFQQQHRFIDFKAFTDANNKTWVFGPTTAHHISGGSGFSHPFQIASKDASYIQDIGTGNLYSSVYIHTSNVTYETLAYIAGWASNGAGAVSLSMTRLTLNAQVSANNIFSNSETALVLNATSGFDDYYRTYKPKIYRARTPLYYAIVIDPSSHCIYKVNIGNDDQTQKQPLSLLGSLCLRGDVGGSAFDYDTETLYVGLAGWGTAPGSIAVVSTSQLKLSSSIPLEQFESDPTSLFYRDSFLWVGFNGGSTLLKLDLHPISNNKYSTLPWYLRSISAIHVKHGNKVFFVTNEQFSKVAMADDVHFCYYKCDSHFGYCANTECQCVNGTTLQNDGRTCKPTPIIEQEKVGGASHAGEVALGLLFVVTFIAAAIGWFLLWKTTRHNRRGQYAAASTDDTERFLGDEDH